MKCLYELRLRPVADALHASPAMQLATIADLPLPFLPTMKLTCGSRSICMCPWFMKFSTTILRITPFSYACSSRMVLRARFFPSALLRLFVSSVVTGVSSPLVRFVALPLPRG